MRDCEAAPCGSDDGRSSLFKCNDFDPSCPDDVHLLSSGKFYGAEGFYPAQIIVQIVVIQVVYYACFSFLVFIIFSCLGYPRNAALLFRPQRVTWATKHGGRALLTTHVVTSAFMASCVAFVVERTKKCLDFVITLYFLHWIFCYFVSGFSQTPISFWIAQILSIALTTVLAERICMKTELQEIVLQKKFNAELEGSNSVSTGCTSALPKPSNQVVRPRPDLVAGTKPLHVTMELGTLHPLTEKGTCNRNSSVVYVNNTASVTRPLNSGDSSNSSSTSSVAPPTPQSITTFTGTFVASQNKTQEERVSPRC